MSWIVGFFSDLGGSLMGGRFYSNALSYSSGRAWRFLLIFLLLTSIVLTMFYFRVASTYYDVVVDYMAGNNFKVVFDNGTVSNMPARLKLIAIEDETILKIFPAEGDTLAVWEWIRGWPGVDSLRELHPNVNIYIGPKEIFSYSGDERNVTKFPAGYTGTVDAEYLKNLKTGYSWIIFLVMLIISYIISIPWSALAILVFIVPILAIKFSKMGMKFGEMWKLGMFLVSFHMLYVMIITVLNIQIPYDWVWNFPIYMFVIAFLVRIDPDILEKRGRPGLPDQNRFRAV